MGHVDLAAPVSHIWFFKGVPSRIGYLIDMAPKELEKVLYFAASVITWVDEEARQKDLGKLEKEVEKQARRVRARARAAHQELKSPEAALAFGVRQDEELRRTTTASTRTTSSGPTRSRTSSG
jgi:DNA-directed RNA polymerase subunit beta'